MTIKVTKLIYPSFQGVNSPEDNENDIRVIESPSWENDFKGMTFAQFWTAIGKPVTIAGHETGIFDYEQEVIDALDKHRHVWVKKARGLGLTELILRYMAWLCLKDDSYRGGQMAIITGPRLDTAIDLIKRIKRFFIGNSRYVLAETRSHRVMINGCLITAYPSNANSSRGQDRMHFIFLDEADYFEGKDQLAALEVAEGYIGKSNPWIVLNSTPNLPGGMYDQIENDPNSIYEKIFLSYERGLGKIYTDEHIALAKQSPHFPREYCLMYGYGVGNVFASDKIDACIADYDIEQEPPKCPKSLGIDMGFGSSKSAFVASRLNHGKIEILHASEFERADFNDMVAHAMNLIVKHSIEKVYVDGSNPEFIRALKKLMGERVDYDKAIEDAKRMRMDYERMMKVVPIYFSQENLDMLTWAQELVSSNQLSTKAEFKQLLTQMRSCKTNAKGTLGKSSQQSYDLIDATFLNLRRYHY